MVTTKLTLQGVSISKYAHFWRSGREIPSYFHPFVLETAGPELIIVEIMKREIANGQARQETTMYPFDTNINTALERHAEQLRLVRSYGLLEPSKQAASAWAADHTSQPSWVARTLTLVLAAAAPILLLMALGLMIR
jgi:hypothetical protein